MAGSLFDRWYRVLAGIIIGLLVLLFLYKVRMVFTPFILAAAIAYIINPVVRHLERRQVPRVAAILVVYMAIAVAATLIILFIIPIASEEIDHFMKIFPGEVERLKAARYQAYREYRRDGIPETVKAIVDETIRDIEETFIQFLRSIVEGILGIFSHAFNIILAPVLAFYMTRDIENIKATLLSWLPWSKRGYFLDVLSDVDEVIGGYIRGQLMVSTIIALLSSIGLHIIGVDFSIILGVLAGLANIIPYFGPLIGAIPAMGVALITSHKLALYTALVFAIVQYIDNSIVSPKIIGESVGLHPLIVIFVLLVGGQLMGIAGMLIAVPVAAMIKVLLKHFRRLIIEPYLRT